jgi:uncharacterized membrane protein YhaH (DUF805 family)
MKVWLLLLILGIFAALGLLSFTGLIFSFDPFQASGLVIALVYLSIFFSLSGIFSLAAFLIRRLKRRKKPLEKDLLFGFWAGLIISLCAVISLVFLAII